MILKEIVHLIVDEDGRLHGLGDVQRDAAGRSIPALLQDKRSWVPCKHRINYETDMTCRRISRKCCCCIFGLGKFRGQHSGLAVMDDILVILVFSTQIKQLCIYFKISPLACSLQPHTSDIKKATDPAVYNLLRIYAVSIVSSKGPRSEI